MHPNKIWSRILFIAATTIVSWMLIGVEVFYGEHGEASYEPFIKRRFTHVFFVKNTATCGECDFRSLENILDDARIEFSDYCSIRRGIDAIEECHQILLEEDRAATARFSRNIR